MTPSDASSTNSGTYWPGETARLLPEILAKLDDLIAREDACVPRHARRLFALHRLSVLVDSALHDIAAVKRLEAAMAAGCALHPTTIAMLAEIRAAARRDTRRIRRLIDRYLALRGERIPDEHGQDGRAA